MERQNSAAVLQRLSDLLNSYFGTVVTDAYEGAGSVHGRPGSLSEAGDSDGSGSLPGRGGPALHIYLVQSPGRHGGGAGGVPAPTGNTWRTPGSCSTQKRLPHPGNGVRQGMPPEDRGQGRPACTSARRPLGPLQGGKGRGQPGYAGGLPAGRPVQLPAGRGTAIPAQKHGEIPLNRCSDLVGYHIGDFPTPAPLPRRGRPASAALVAASALCPK